MGTIPPPSPLPPGLDYANYEDSLYWQREAHYCGKRARRYALAAIFLGAVCLFLIIRLIRITGLHEMAQQIEDIQLEQAEPSSR
jgi:hypothetical protein